MTNEKLMRSAFDTRESRLNSRRLFVLLLVGGAVGLLIGVVYVFSGVSF
jgi:uncharacterized membrane protein YsdA (DUF1294 family)